MLQSLSDRQSVLTHLTQGRSSPRGTANNTASRPESLLCGKSEPIPLGLKPRRQHSVPQLLCGRLGNISYTGKHTAVEARPIQTESVHSYFKTGAQLSCPTSEAATALNNSFILKSSASDSSAQRLKPNMGTCSLHIK